jgi:hypothetical protein
MKNELEDLSPREREAFASLAKESMPPPLLEERIVESLKRQNLIRPLKSGHWPGFPKVGAAIAASLALLIIGIAVGIWWAAAPSKDSSLPEFMLVIRESSVEAQPATSEEAIRRVKEYSAWAKAVEQRGLLVAGEKLKDEARLLSVVDGRAVSVSRSELRENDIGGYFLIQARDYEHAIAIAEGCPHLKYGGTVEVRQIERF